MEGDPLSWVLVSADPQGSALHPEIDGARAMEAAVRAKDCGGTHLIGTNTTLSSAVPLDQLIAIGQRCERLGVDQWSVGGLYQPRGGRLEDTLREDEVKAALDAIVNEFRDSATNITINLSSELFARWAGGSHLLRSQPNSWRMEMKVSDNVLLIAPNAKPGYFIRLRWDGELLDHDDLLTVGVLKGAFGTYHPGHMRQTLESFVDLRANSTGRERR